MATMNLPPQPAGAGVIKPSFRSGNNKRKTLHPSNSGKRSRKNGSGPKQGLVSKIDVDYSRNTSRSGSATDQDNLQQSPTPDGSNQNDSAGNSQGTSSNCLSQLKVSLQNVSELDEDGSRNQEVYSSDNNSHLNGPQTGDSPVSSTMLDLASAIPTPVIYAHLGNNRKIFKFALRLLDNASYNDEILSRENFTIPFRLNVRFNAYKKNVEVVERLLKMIEEL